MRNLLPPLSWLFYIKHAFFFSQISSLTLVLSNLVSMTHGECFFLGVCVLCVHVCVFLTSWICRFVVSITFGKLSAFTSLNMIPVLSPPPGLSLFPLKHCGHIHQAARGPGSLMLCKFFDSASFILDSFYCFAIKVTNLFSHSA